MSFKVIGVKYKGKGQPGDFKLYAGEETILLLPNENVVMMHKKTPGSGTACVRGQSNVRGIPTGWSPIAGGFEKFGLHERQVIDAAFDSIKLYLHEHLDVKVVMFSCDPSDKDKIGTDIFNVCTEALDYINMQLHELKSYDRDKPLKTSSQIRDVFKYSFEYAVATHRIFASSLKYKTIPNTGRRLAGTSSLQHKRARTQ